VNCIKCRTTTKKEAVYAAGASEQGALVYR